jgi:hypothetical protein
MMIDEDLWTSILQPYKFDSASALSMAQVLYSLREDIKRGNSEQVVEILTDGIEKLHVFSPQHKTSHEDYWRAVRGDG